MSRHAHQALLDALRYPPRDRQRAIDRAFPIGSAAFIESASFRGHDLSGLSLTHISMSRVDWRGAKCDWTSFPCLSECTLDGIQAHNACFPRLERCSFRQAHLDGAKIGARITECDFAEALLPFAKLGHMPSAFTHEFRGNDFTRANLHGIDACGGFLAGASFGQSRLTNARLSRAILAGCNLRGADLSGANLCRSTLTLVDATDSVLDGCVLCPEQAAALLTSRPTRAEGLIEMAPSSGPRTLELIGALDNLVGWRLDWRLVSTKAHPAEDIMLSKRTDGLHASAFRADSRVLVRLYPWEGPRELSTVLEDLAVDYADWRLQLGSISVEVPTLDSIDEMRRQLCGALEEVFRIE